MGFDGGGDFDGYGRGYGRDGYYGRTYHGDRYGRRGSPSRSRHGMHEQRPAQDQGEAPARDGNPDYAPPQN
jgi:hypothetical protein